MNPNKRVYRPFTEQQKRLIVYLRYGSQTNFDQIINKVCDIAEYLRSPWCSVKQVLNKFVSSEYDITTFKFRSRRFKHMPENMKAFLIDPKTLQTWMPYTLLERSRVASRLFNFNVSRTQLQRFYKSSGIKYVTGKTIYKAAAVHKERLDE